MQFRYGPNSRENGLKKSWTYYEYNESNCNGLERIVKGSPEMRQLEFIDNNMEVAGVKR